jgi:ribA/ribD-fused uncharacterized protein
MAPTWPPDNMPCDREALSWAVRAGARPTTLSFPDWGGAPPLGWLAPWTPTPFETTAGRFGSGEHHFMHGKALLFGDRTVASKILRSASAGQARELGRRINSFREDIWEAKRAHVMDEANRAKFMALPELADYLVSTWPAVLLQASALDRVWSAGLDLGDTFLSRPDHWPGLNLVGFSLMRLRERLRAAGLTASRGGASRVIRG